MRRYYLCLFFLVLFPAIGLADAADDFIRLGQTARAQIQNPFYDEIGADEGWRGEDLRLSDELCGTPELLPKVFAQAANLPPDLLAVLLNRIRFRVHQENQSELLPFIPEEFVDRIHSGTRVTPPLPQDQKPPDLSQGTWHQTPDGRKFWVSDTNPDLILSPAEYQHLLTNDQD